MKIMDNPALGIGLLLCIGLAIFGIALMTTAGGQAPTAVMITSDDGAFALTSSDDSDDSPFITREATPPRPRDDRARIEQADRARAEQARAQDAAAQQRQRQQSSVRIENPPADPFAAPPREQPRDQQRGQQVVIERRIESNPPVVAMTRQQVANAEKRDELLFRIVKLRLKRGEYEQLAPIALQMQNPEKVVEMMLDLAEKMEAENEESFAKLLDVATVVLLHLGQPRPPVMVPPMPGMSGGMGGGMIGPGMPGMMPMGMPPGQPMPGQPMPGQPMMGWSSSGTPSGMPGQPMPMGGGMSGGMMGGTGGMPMPHDQQQPLPWDGIMQKR